jgi:hypothetical protein
MAAALSLAQILTGRRFLMGLRASLELAHLTVGLPLDR